MSQGNDNQPTPTEEILKQARFETGDDSITLQAANPDTTHDVESDDPTSSVDVVALQAQLEAAQAQVNEGRDALLRMQAEMENQRRRNEKQVEDAHKYSVQRFVEGLLPVIDSLEMGLTVEGDIVTLREGMNLTLKQLSSTLEKFKVEAIDPQNQHFNPEKHQAVSLLNSPDHANDTVINVLQKGYSLNGRVIRPAMVIVCKK